jgi:hypothetical protein
MGQCNVISQRGDCWRLTSASWRIVTAALLVAMCQSGLAQPPTATGPRERDALTDAETKTVEGRFIASHTVQTDGKVIEVPDGCAIRIALPFGKRAVGWETIGEPLIDSETKRCWQAIKIGVPSRAAKRESFAPRIKAREWSTTTYTQVDWYVQWVDPINIPVAWAQSGMTYRWSGPLFCAEYSSGGFFLSESLSATGWARLGSWNVGVTGSCNVVGFTGSTVHMNAVFPGCSIYNPMFLYFEPHSVDGDQDGTVYGTTFTYTAGGPCRFLL